MHALGGSLGPHVTCTHLTLPQSRRGSSTHVSPSTKVHLYARSSNLLSLWQGFDPSSLTSGARVLPLHHTYASVITKDLIHGIIVENCGTVKGVSSALQPLALRRSLFLRILISGSLEEGTYKYLQGKQNPLH